jgi:hypothetical protein
MLASLLVFRVLYYLIPMIVAIVVYGWYEAQQAPILTRLRKSGRMARLGMIAATRSARALARRIEAEFRKRPGPY